MAKMYGIGASVVIIGALFKIQHWEYAGPLLIAGLGTEALIFFFSAFEKQHEEPDWSLVYPELATPENGKPKRVTEQLDNMLQDANIESDLIERLGTGMRHLGEQASKMGDVADASVATKEYSASLQEASSKVTQLGETYAQASENLSGIADASEMGATVGAHMQTMSENLSSLNSMYADQMKQLEYNQQLYTGMGDLVQNLTDSVEDTKLYKVNIAELSKNLAALNTVYGNMLNAMGSRG